MNTNEQETPEMVSTDQTAFGSTVPLFEREQVLIDPLAPPPVVQPPLWKKPLVLIGVALLLIALVLMMVVAALQPGQNQIINTPTPSPTSTLQSGPWQTRVTTLQAELKSADPAQQELPFPPVKMDLPLETSRR